MTSQPPAWFEAALAQRPCRHEVALEGATVHYRVWGDSWPGVILVHGAGGHSAWWDHVAPQLGGRVVAVDLTGHGDSGRRPVYSIAQWAREIRAVAAAEDLRAPHLVGHSMGGRVAVAASALGPAAGVTCIDSQVYPVSANIREARSPRRAPRVHATAQAAVDRFRTIPPQESLPYVRAHVAAQSLRAVEGGWTWKSGDGTFGLPPTLRELVAGIDPTLPLAFLRSSEGVVDEEMVAALVRAAPGEVHLVELPAAGHHPMLDRPLELVRALRAVLSAQEAATAAVRSAATSRHVL
ncbi:alpha/beta hydrolase [Pseudonocardia sp. K10HN5]|uniref:Alpha/beta hydrolase n=1 Tax=Pseudonocardia acidicola TaxID=2724939 RepID=A0ABX1SBI1_9PSEU|nr:alpha/beta hydrolase [Pseudonocardia acidicola]NMH98222.1 alpha/beta hydrolase [Pseudonocardia acidicola]